MKGVLGTAAIIAFASIGMASGASASTLMLASGSTTCSLSDFTIGEFNASSCEGAYAGNDSNSNLDGIFDIDGWTEIAKVDIPEKKSGPFTNGSLTVNGNGTSGTWSVSGWGGNSPVMAVIKGGPTFSAYLLGDPSANSGTWSTDGVLKGNYNSGPGLSHLTLYTSDTTPTPIPLPAAGWMLLAGLGGFVAMRRRKAATAGKREIPRRY